MAKDIRLTDTYVEKIVLPEKGRDDYFDERLKGFGVRASKTKKVYFVLRRVNGKLSRVTMGQTDSLSSNQARKLAENIIAELNQGKDVNDNKKKERLKNRTLDEILKEYLQKPALKPNTIKTCQKLADKHLNSWLKLPLSEITADMVESRHKKIAATSGKAPANNTMRTLRAVYNYALADSDLPVNPVRRLTLKKLWFKIPARKTLITCEDLAAWYDVVKKHHNIIAQDYFRLLLFTGLRREEAATLQWKTVNMARRFFTVIDPKNGHDHTLPMSDFIYEIFVRRLALQINEYVFPGTGEAGCLRDPRKSIVAISEESGVRFCNHDLRRTFATVAEGLVSYSALKRFLNHSSQNDVTQGYIHLGLEGLREPMQRITDALLGYCEKEPTVPGKVINIRSVRRCSI